MPNRRVGPSTAHAKFDGNTNMAEAEGREGMTLDSFGEDSNDEEGDDKFTTVR